ncbi:solute carrier family 28 member 3-like [Clinocottus analis]|uniref:solute carrier family 28 member 3-like n=1 Tax=Clinocottus analis TaxID=304258 RepID=UPI0035C25FC0
MELDVIERKNQKRGKDNKALELEEQEQIYIEVDSATEVADDAHKKTDQHIKSLLEKKIEAFQDYLAQHKKQICLIVRLLIAAGVVAIVIAACVLNFNRAVEMLVISVVTVIFLAWDWMMKRYGDRVWEELSPVRDVIGRNWFWIRWVGYVSMLVVVGGWLVLDTAKRGSRQLVSFAGLLLIVFCMLIFSKHPFRWCWQTLVCGIGLQFVCGLLILRTTFGLVGIEWIGKKAETFMSFADVGSKFVFGASYQDHLFVFKVMPILVFISSVISILFYVGFMPWLVGKIGFIMQVTMATSPAESMAAAGNLFLGQTESPLLIRPYISELTRSEMHAVMTAGFASVSGGVLGAYISFGVEATHLLTATVMSIPASLAMAKTFWPETETTRVTASNLLKMKHGDSQNMFAAASHGASCAIGAVAEIVVNLLAFLSLLAFIDAALSWLGGMLDCPQLSFSLICSYVFMPLSFMLGVSWEDSFIVAELIGLKTFINEFIAYQKLSEFITKRKAGGPEYVGNVKQYISIHSETIATYALCGFSNFGSMGSAIGFLSFLAPNRKTDISSTAFRALIAGSFSCFMTACIAGILYIPDLHCPHFLSTEFINANVTTSLQLVTCCTQLYNSVTVYESWNVTSAEGFSQSSLQRCCALTPPTHFNCSLVL